MRSELRALAVVALFASAMAGAHAAGPAAAPLDINSASRAQLMTLPGIGADEAERIVVGRPYLSKADLASKKVLPAGVYLALKHRLIAKQGRLPAPPRR